MIEWVGKAVGVERERLWIFNRMGAKRTRLKSIESGKEACHV